MQDTTKQDTTQSPGEAANNNVGELSEMPIGSEAAAPPDEIDVAALETELAEAKDRLLRALAETENVRRRAQREREETAKYAVAGFAKELLAVADNLRRALDSLPEAEARDERTRSLLAGVEATERELLRVFERHGIRRIDPKRERFDHNFHEAVFEAERPGNSAGTIIEVLQPGYVLHDRLLRPAMVGVAKDPESPEPVESSGTSA
jgi:molecular chaperone GrpE